MARFCMERLVPKASNDQSELRHENRTVPREGSILRKNVADLQRRKRERKQRLAVRLTEERAGEIRTDTLCAAEEGRLRQPTTRGRRAWAR
jgi:hypothetical protein